MAMTDRTRSAACGAALVLALAACGSSGQAAQSSAEPSAKAPATTPEEALAEEPAEDPSPSQEPLPSRAQGLVAGPTSTAFPIEGRNLRLVRSGEKELALQLDLFNGTDKEISLGTVGLDSREQLIALVDLPRATAYGLVGGSGPDGRISEDLDIEPGQSAPVTAVFTAPPEETTEMLVVANGLLPVTVPITDDELTDDPALHGPYGKAQVGPLVCRTADGAREKFRLPSDVLFEFGSSRLSPAARSAIEGLRGQISAPSGSVTVDGHTDGVGGDSANQKLSEERAAAVGQVLRPSLGDGFAFQAKGHGESDPVAPNTKPDGSDDPDGRAQNRRVEVQVEGDTTVQAPATGGELSEAGLQARVQSVRRLSGYLLASVKVTNPGSEPASLEYENHFTPKELTTGQLSITDQNSRGDLCGFAEPTYFDFIGTMSAGFAPGELDSVPAGAEVTLWGLFPAPSASVTSVKVQLGGYGEPLQAEISAD
ncbi:OmpA family protein [Nonomuraea jiangxiensis]|uniref:OmpA family protein n=1 Tax=Nonomuraea jiangxiensis TaxID=633440 RepID=A0A1G9SM48_9ACTN|nr:OmpA family protein [Nonomuraea jiangxiensis]SDM36544.1 OmpA family protein [Nonomuraea jiangxiensis]